MADNSYIEVRRNNLYAHALFIQFEDGTQQVVRKRLEWKGETGDRYYSVQKGDELSNIAWRMYLNRAGDNASELWWAIADVNGIVNPFDMESWVGRSLLIPDYDKLQLLL